MKKFFLLTATCLSVVFAQAQVDFTIYATAASSTPTLVVGKDGTTTVNGLLKVTDALKLPAYPNSYFSTAPSINGILAYNTDAGLLMLATGGTWTSITKGSVGVDSGKVYDCSSSTYSFTLPGFSYTGTGVYEIGMNNLSDASLALANGTNAAWNSGIFTATANPAPSTFVAEVTSSTSLPNSLYTYIPPSTVPSIISVTLRGTRFAFSNIQSNPAPTAMLGTNILKDYNSNTISSVSTNKITYSMSYYPIPLLKDISGAANVSSVVWDNLPMTLDSKLTTTTPTFLTTTPTANVADYTLTNGNVPNIPLAQALNLYYANQAFLTMNRKPLDPNASNSSKYQGMGVQFGPTGDANSTISSPIVWLGYSVYGENLYDGAEYLSSGTASGEVALRYMGRTTGSSIRGSTSYNTFRVLSMPKNLSRIYRTMKFYAETAYTYTFFPIIIIYALVDDIAGPTWVKVGFFDKSIGASQPWIIPILPVKTSTFLFVMQDRNQYASIEGLILYY